MVKNFLSCKILRLVALFLSICLPLSAVKVTAVIESARIAENRKLEGKIQVTHLTTEKVDDSAFQLNGQPLKVESLTSVANGAEIVSDYRFQIPGKPRGLYGLPAIMVMVNGKAYYSAPTTYEVTSSQASNSLELEAVVNPMTPLYPSQHALFTYRIYYNRNIELTAEELPFLEAAGFQKVGDKTVKDSQTEEYTIQEITQEVRALEPGEYAYGPSHVEGFVYKEDLTGTRVYEKPRLRADADPIKILVKAFPQQGRPPSFAGTVGQYKVKARLTTPKEVNIGDKVEVGFSVTGEGEIDSVSMPDIACQPGFSGFFELGAYPYFEQRNTNGKEFILTFRPLSADVKAIPNIEFSYFDPLSQQYQTVSSEPLPLNVRPYTFQAAPRRAGYEEPKGAQLTADVSGVDHHLALGKADELTAPRPFELEPSDLSPPHGTIQDVWWALAVFPVLIGGQLALRRFRTRKKPLPKRIKSEDYLALAIQSKGQSARVFTYLEKCFFLLLQEKGYYDRVLTSAERLSTEGDVGLIRQFLVELEERRFGKGELLTDRQVLKDAKRLYNQIRFGR